MNTCLSEKGPCEIRDVSCELCCPGRGTQASQTCKRKFVDCPNAEMISPHKGRKQWGEYCEDEFPRSPRPDETLFGFGCPCCAVREADVHAHPAYFSPPWATTWRHRPRLASLASQAASRTRYRTFRFSNRSPQTYRLALGGGKTLR